MNTIAKAVTALVIAAGVAGCDQLAFNQTGAEPAGGKTADKGKSDYLADLTVRSENDQKDHRSAAEAALEWMKKYSHAADELSRVRKANGQLREKNQALLAENARLRTEHEAMKRELDDANAMTIELSRALNKWKADVLGFRDEIRKAEQVKLEMLGKIMVLVGGEAPPNPAVKPAPAAPATKPEADKDAGDADGKESGGADAK